MVYSRLVGPGGIESRRCQSRVGCSTLSYGPTVLTATILHDLPLNFQGQIPSGGTVSNMAKPYHCGYEVIWTRPIGACANILVSQEVPMADELGPAVSALQRKLD